MRLSLLACVGYYRGCLTASGRQDDTRTATWLVAAYFHSLVAAYSIGGHREVNRALFSLARFRNQFRHPGGDIFDLHPVLMGEKVVANSIKLLAMRRLKLL
jgi:hypothetical protein